MKRLWLRQIADMRALIAQLAPDLDITQDLGLGMMLWMTQFFPDEGWARTQKARCLKTLDQMWIEDGYFCRELRVRYVKYAFTNYGVSVGLQAVNAMPERIRSLNAIFRDLPLRRRVRSRCYHPCHGLQFAFPWLSRGRLPSFTADLRDLMIPSNGLELLIGD